MLIDFVELGFEIVFDFLCRMSESEKVKPQIRLLLKGFIYLCFGLVIGLLMTVAYLIRDNLIALSIIILIIAVLLIGTIRSHLKK